MHDLHVLHMPPVFVDCHEQCSLWLGLVIREFLAVLRKEILELASFRRLFSKWSETVHSE